MTPKRAALIAWATKAAHELADILGLPENDAAAPPVKRRHGRRTPTRPVVSETQMTVRGKPGARVGEVDRENLPVRRNRPAPLAL